MNNTLRAACMIAIVSAVGLSGIAHAQARFAIDQPGQSLADAIRGIGMQTATNILFDPALVAGKTAVPLHGQLTAEEALSKLLTGTGLVVRKSGDNALVIQRADASRGDPATGAQNKGADAAVLSATGSDRLDEVLVTAQKRTQSVRDVPATVVVISADEIESAGIKDLFQASVLIPGTTFSRAPDDGLQLTIRGLGTPARTQSFDQSVALFLDGSFLGKGRLYSAPFFDVERIEVIKGTQSTLLGKNTSLGAISIVSRRPGTEFEGSVSAGREVVNGGTFFDGAVTLPVSNALRFRVAGIYSDTDGWVLNRTTGNRVPMDLDKAARAMMVWDADSGFDATLSYQYADSRRTGNGYQFVDPLGRLPASLGEGIFDDTKAGFVSQGLDGESVHRTKAHLGNLTLNLAIGDHTLTTVSSYDSYKIAFVDDFDFGNKDATYFARSEDYRQFSQEVRIASPDTRQFSYLAGVFYFDSDWTSVETQIYNTPVFVPPLGGNIFQGGFTNDFRQSTKTLSGFVSTTNRFTARARLNLGVRYTSEKKDASWRRPAIAPLTPWNQIINPPFALTPLRFDDSFLNGNISFQYDFADTVTGYLGYGRGTKTGGFSESSAVELRDPRLPSTAGGSAVKSEQADSFELGVKGSSADRQLTYEVAAFYTQVHDFQDTTFTGASFDTANLDVRSVGVETKGQLRLNSSLRFDAALTYADAKVTSLPQRPVPGAPAWTGHAGFNFEHAIGAGGLKLFGNTYYRYRGSMVHQRVQSFRSAPWRTVDASIGIGAADDRWDVRISGSNLFNDQSADFSGPPADPTLDPSIRIDAPSPLRAVRLAASYRF